MSDRDPDASPEQEARIRGLLADARHGDPIPVDVAARLDRVLDQLASERPAALEPVEEVFELAARRRRRVTGLLVAAAAVVVLGVGIGQVTRTDDSPGDSGSAGSSPAADNLAESADGATADNSQKNGPTRPGSDESAEAVGPPQTNNMTVAPPPVRLTERGFARQVLRYRDVSGYRVTGDGGVSSSQLSQSDAFMCATADWGEGKLVAAVYDGLPAVLAYRPQAGTTQTVDLLRCGTGEVLRSTVLAQR